jgi:hypothetical protein
MSSIAEAPEVIPTFLYHDVFARLRGMYGPHLQRVQRVEGAGWARFMGGTFEADLQVQDQVQDQTPRVVHIDMESSQQKWTDRATDTTAKPTTFEAIVTAHKFQLPATPTPTPATNRIALHFPSREDNNPNGGNLKFQNSGLERPHPVAAEKLERCDPRTREMRWAAEAAKQIGGIISPGVVGGGAGARGRPASRSENAMGWTDAPRSGPSSPIGIGFGTVAQVMERRNYFKTSGKKRQRRGTGGS